MLLDIRAKSSNKGAMLGNKGALLGDKGALSVEKAQKLINFEVFNNLGIL